MCACVSELNKMRPTRSLRLRKLIVFIIVMLLFTSCSNSQVVIGFAGEITGNESDLGISARNGVLLGVEQVNRLGGIDGRDLTVLVRDDQGKPEGAQAVDRELIEAGVVAIIGHITSSQTVAGLEVTEPAGMVMLSSISSSPDLTGLDDLFFRVCADNGYEYQVLSEWMLEQGQSHLVIFYDTSNLAFTLPYAQGVEKQMLAKGATNVEIIPFSEEAFQMTDSPISAAASGQPDAVLVVASAVNSALMVQYMRMLEWQVPVYISDWSYTDVFLQTGGRVVEGVSLVVSFDVNSQTLAMRDFRQLYIERFGYKPNYAAMQSYEAALVLAEALKQTEGQAAGLPEALKNIKDVPGLLSNISLNEYGDVIRPTYLLQVHNGEFEVVKTIQRED